MALDVIGGKVVKIAVSSDEQRLKTLIQDDEGTETDIDTLLAKANSSWTDTDRSSSQKISLRKLEITDLRRKLNLS